ncbi:MAG: hypothetical protein JW806_09515 [Sedimentisphaerales bacterium]|nr:hypothetical protein [Sedimentisphaerales bacterium]
MGFRSKLLFLLIVYFAGFATAIYYLAPAGSNRHQTDNPDYSYFENKGTATGVLDRFCEKAISKATAGFSSMNSDDFRAYLDQGLEKLRQMAQPSQAEASEGTEDK